MQVYREHKVFETDEVFYFCTGILSEIEKATQLDRCSLFYYLNFKNEYIYMNTIR